MGFSLFEKLPEEVEELLAYPLMWPNYGPTGGRLAIATVASSVGNGALKGLMMSRSDEVLITLAGLWEAHRRKILPSSYRTGASTEPRNATVSVSTNGWKEPACSIIWPGIWAFSLEAVVEQFSRSRRVRRKSPKT
jgi:hypothetical protein